MMKKLPALLFAILLTFSASAQLLRTDDAVEVDILLGDTLKNNWKKATVVGYDSVGKIYKVKILDGDRMDIPSRNPEMWIRPAITRNLLIKYGPGAKIPFQSREKMIQPVDCRPTEKFIKKNLRSLMAAEYKDFQFIHVEFPKYKPQHGYNDPHNEGQFIYPYELEWLVHLKRDVMMGGRLYTEYQTWEYDREYAYATRGKKKCEFYPLEMDPPKLVSRGWFVR
jgi:hypothetical protein